MSARTGPAILVGQAQPGGARRERVEPMSSTALWYASRATGVIALVLLTAVLVLGMLVSRQGRLPGLPRFAATSLHRSVSLMSVVFVAVHVATAIADPFVTIGIAGQRGAVRLALRAVLARAGRGVGGPDDRADRDQPAAGADRPPDLARGALAGLRQLAGRARAQHRLRPDMRHGWMLDLGMACAAAVAAAAGLAGPRRAAGGSARRERGRR